MDEEGVLMKKDKIKVFEGWMDKRMLSNLESELGYFIRHNKNSFPDPCAGGQVNIKVTFEYL